MASPERPARGRFSRILVTALAVLGLASTGLVLNTAAATTGTFGTVAGQSFDYCFADSAPVSDDSSSAPVPIPASFPLTFYGNSYDTLYVNTNGNITFGTGVSEYVPGGMDQSNYPMIAPYWSDHDPRGNGIPATYGWSPDGTQFCAVWRDSGEYSHGTVPVTTQLLLTKATGAGRSAGDFDITFNYDTVGWLHGGAAVGYTAGSGAPGTFAQIGDLGTNFLDSSPTALISGSRNSSQAGRYVFQIRNDGYAATLGSMHGIVKSDNPDDADPGVTVANASVQATRSGTDARPYSAYTTSNPAGAFRFDGLPAGTYRVTAWSPNPGMTPGGATTEVIVGGDTDAGDIVVTPPDFMPSNATLNGTTGTGDLVPTVYWGSPTDLTVQGCAAAAAPEYWVTLATGEEIARGPLAESPAGTYSGTIAAFHPSHGGATIHTNIPRTCGGTPTAFDIYIDPSGTVVDQDGHPVQGATVTLLRSDTEAGPFTPVPDGSTIMSPSNRANPSTTDAAGAFGWDVLPGWYKVQASAPGCTDGSTDVMEVPPPRLNLVIPLQCGSGGTPGKHPAPHPESPPTITGTPKVGATLTAHDGTWPEPAGVWDLSRQWLRNGTPIPGATGQTYDLQPVDEGQSIKIEVTAIRAGYENGVADSAPVTVLPADPPPPPDPTPLAATSDPSITGAPAWGQTLTVDPGQWDGDGVSFAYQWLRDGAPISGATSSTYPVGKEDVGHSLAATVVASAPHRLDGSATSAAVAVPKVSSTLTSALSSTKVAAGTRPMLTLGLTVPSPALAVGKIRISVDGVELRTVRMRLKDGGARSIRLPAMPIGEHQITAEYLGGQAIAPSEAAPAVLTVVKK